MTQNIYDNPEFFAGYSRLGRSVEGLEGAAEWPALRSLLPDLRRLRVVDLGCGFGWFCRWAREQGAAEVLGIDVSEKMLARARDTTTDTAVTYLRADIERLDLPEAGFYLAYSSLALHYIQDLAGLLVKLHCALVPGGHLVFSVEHPIFTAPRHPGWSVDADGCKTWPVDNYLCEGLRTTDWLAEASSSSTALWAHISTSCFDWASRSLMSRSGARPTSRSWRTRPGPRNDSGRCFCSLRLGGEGIRPVFRQSQPPGQGLTALSQEKIVEELSPEDAVDAKITKVVPQFAPRAEQGHIDVVSHCNRTNCPARMMTLFVDIGNGDFTRFVDRMPQVRRVDPVRRRRAAVGDVNRRGDEMRL